ncbi:MAG: WecB/TagA/CpsF family glycosyltransferase [Gudongella sp.]|jgi:N-acetylglucosaminyldiphosphoundecaprenol N-acetyl-beta-D-mannosaminyltransferase|nr:WecB/TagA/CpsF family glycosyltransferase [Gudongella sp.]
MSEKVNIFGVEIHNTTLDILIQELKEHLKKDKSISIFTPNTEIVMEAKKSKEQKEILNSGNYIIPDGIGLIYGAKLRGIELKERVTGYDTSLALLDIANQNGYGLYLLGGKEGVAKKAEKALSKSHPGIRITGTHNGYFEGTHLGKGQSLEERTIIDDIKANKTDILFVGFGFPRQEKWINDNINKTGVKVAIGNGGVIDILAGDAKRAPDVFIKLGLEWLYRLIKDPSRIKRQIVLPLFIIQVLISKKSITRII